MNQLGKPHGAIGVSDHHGIISPAYFVAEISEIADPRYVHHLLRTRLYVSEYERRGKFMPPSQFDISWDDFRNIDVSLPPMAEQRAIADYLDAETARIDALIAKKQQLIHLLEERWRSTRNSYVLRGLSPVDSTGNRVTDWSYPTLGVLVEMQRGHDLPSDERIQGDVPIVSSGGISDFHNTPAARGPGVVTGRYGTIGEVYFIEGDYWPLNTTLYVRDFRGNDPYYVAMLLESLPLEAESEKSAVGGINRNVIGKLRVPKPPLAEQTAMARRLSTYRQLNEQFQQLLERQINLLTKRRQALITAAVTGEFQVPGAG